MSFSTSTDDLSRAVLKFIKHPDPQPGIYHLVNKQECTWYEITKAIYEIMGTAVKVGPVDRKGMTGAMRCPFYSVLGNREARKMGITLPRWRDGLARYLHDKCGIPAHG